MMSSIFGCSTDAASNKEESGSGYTLSDKNAEANGILSQDDAEVLIYNQLHSEEKEHLHIDYLKEDGTKYVIRVYEDIDGTEKVKKIYTVDFRTEEVEQIK
jgi:hypothetical protein